MGRKKAHGDLVFNYGNTDMDPFYGSSVRGPPVASREDKKSVGVSSKFSI